MKILHTSDWHLGHRLHEHSQQEEQLLFFDWLIEYINANAIDVLLVSGDIFDVGVPSAQMQKMYYDFLVRLHHTNCQEVILTGGNHDAPSTLNAPKELLSALSIKIIGKATENVADTVFQLSVRGEELLVAAIPYLRDQDIRRAIASESAEEINNRYKTALINHFTEAAVHCDALKKSNMTVIGMGHLFAIGGKTSDSEQTIYVGNLGDIGAADFPESFDYVALGHLHRAQKVGDKEHIRYSGSPYILSFSEVGQDKKVIAIETGESLTIKEVTVPAFRKIIRIEGTVESCKAQLEILNNEHNELTPWVDLILTNEKEAVTGIKEIRDFAEDIRPQVLNYSIKGDGKLDKLKSLVDNAKHIKSFTPLEVFKLKCDEMNVDLEEKPEILDAFNEILQIALNEDA